MNHRHSNLFYAVLVLLALTLSGFNLPGILKGSQKEKPVESEKTAKNDKPYVVPAPVIDAIANVFYKWTIEKAKIEDKLTEKEGEGEKLAEKEDKEDNTLNKDLKIQVRKVFEKLKEAAERSEYGETAKEFKWEVNVIKDDKIENAFAWPGGKITIYTGIWPIAKDETGLAAVLGHEMIHALARHAAHRINRDVIAGLPVTALVAGGAMAMDKPEVTVPIMVALGGGLFGGCR